MCSTAAMRQHLPAYAQPRRLTGALAAAGHARGRSRSFFAARGGPRRGGAVYGRSGCFLVSERIMTFNQR